MRKNPIPALKLHLRKRTADTVVQPKAVQVTKTTATQEEGQPASLDDCCWLARDFLADAREDLARADNKASILLATVGVVIGATVAGLLASTWSPAKLDQPWSEAWMVGAGAALIGVGCLVWSIYPRMAKESEDEPTFGYFGHASKLSEKEVRARIEKQARDPLGRLANQVTHVSRIAATKYRWIGRSIAFLAVASSLTIGAVCLDALGRWR